MAESRLILGESTGNAYAEIGTASESMIEPYPMTRSRSTPPSIMRGSLNDSLPTEAEPLGAEREGLGNAPRAAPYVRPGRPRLFPNGLCQGRIQDRWGFCSERRTKGQQDSEKTLQVYR